MLRVSKKEETNEAKRNIFSDGFKAISHIRLTRRASFERIFFIVFLREVPRVMNLRIFSLLRFLFSFLALIRHASKEEVLMRAVLPTRLGKIPNP